MLWECKRAQGMVFRLIRVCWHAFIVVKNRTEKIRNMEEDTISI